MSPEIAQHFRRTYDAWHRTNYGKRVQISEPLPFEVPQGAVGGGDIVELAQHRATTTPERFYGQTILSRSRLWIFLEVMAATFVIIFAGLCLVDLSAERFTTVFWISLAIFGAIYFLARRKGRRADRNACHIFERTTGKAYLYSSEKPHRVYDFYDLHFSISDIMTAPAATSSKLDIGATDPETGDYKGLGTFRLPTNEEAWRFWYALVRYMDRDWPFDDEDMEYFEYLEQERKKQGYRIEGVRHSDGTVEWV